MITSEIIKSLAPIQKKQKELKKNPEVINGILNNGSQKAKKFAAQTIAEIRKALKL